MILLHLFVERCLLYAPPPIRTLLTLLSNHFPTTINIAGSFCQRQSLLGNQYNLNITDDVMKLGRQTIGTWRNQYASYVSIPIIRMRLHLHISISKENIYQNLKRSTLITIFALLQTDKKNTCKQLGLEQSRGTKGKSPKSTLPCVIRERRGVCYIISAWHHKNYGYRTNCTENWLWPKKKYIVKRKRKSNFALAKIDTVSDKKSKGRLASSYLIKVFTEKRKGNISRTLKRSSSLKKWYGAC